MDKKPLRFKNGKFKIMLLGDMHETYDVHSDNAAEKAQDAYALHTKAIETLKPDLAILLGDNVSADNEMELRSAISRVMFPYTSRDIPVAVIFGNHDHDRTDRIDLQTQMRLFNEYDNVYFYNADDSLTGYGNYNLTVKATDSDRDALNLWFLDSNNLTDNPEVSYYDWVHEDQIQWYKKTARELAEKNGGVVPALLFQHAPVPEEYELLREAKPWEYFDSVQGHGNRSDKRYVLKDTVEGYLGEGPCPPCINSGEFAAWKEIGDVIGAFFGHDHMNDFAGYVDGILMAQSRTSAFRVYTDGCRSGVRLITLDENNIENIDTRMYFFKKNFGLKAKSLSPYMRHVTDRQDLKLKVAGAVLGAAAAVTAVAVTASVLKRKCKKNK